MSRRGGTRPGSSGKERKRYGLADQRPVAKKAKAAPTPAPTSGPAEPESFPEGWIQPCACGAELEAATSFLCTCCGEQACKKCEAPLSKEPTSPYCRECGQKRAVEAAGVAAKATDARLAAQASAAPSSSPAAAATTSSSATPAPALGGSSLPAPGGSPGQQSAQNEDSTAEPSASASTPAPAQASSQQAPKGGAKAGGFKTTRKPRLGKDKRVKATRSCVQKRASPAQKQFIPAHLPSNHPCYGTMISGNAKEGYAVRFDDLPVGSNLITIKGGLQHLTPLEEGAEEITPEVPDAQEAARAMLAMLDASLEPVEAEQDAEGVDFAEMDAEQLRGAKKCNVSWKASKAWQEEHGPAQWEWRIRDDDDPITDCKFSPPDTFELPSDIDFADLTKMEDVLYDKLFVDLTGKAKLLDEWASHEKNNIIQDKYNKLKGKKEFVFYDPDHDDPDHYIKEAFTVLLAGTLTPCSGAENLWKRGECGFIAYPDFGQCYDIDMFKVFKAGMPCLFAPKEQWFTPLRDRSWDTFSPALDSFNQRHSSVLLNVCILLLDESMSGWRLVINESCRAGSGGPGGTHRLAASRLVAIGW